MAWPFSNVGSPNFEVGPNAAVPTSSTSVDTVQIWLIGAHFTNDAAVTRIVTVLNEAGTRLWKRSIPAGGEMPYEWPFRPTLGLRWLADGASVTGHIWGYK